MMTLRFRTQRLIAALLCATPFPLLAQDMEPPPVSNALPTDDISGHLRTLARNPHDLNALIGAGQSALSVGDATAALGFFGRANSVAPADGRVKAGLGSTLLLMERPADALRLFGEAISAGVPQSSIAIDRGLAFDLSGDQASAQRDYRLALQLGQSDELVRRYALSLGISGRKNEALTLLDPLLRKQDQAAWRDRTFILAMNGDVRGATSITRSIMPQQADAMAPFLRRLASFTSAQRALAVTYGTMPEDTRAQVATLPAAVAPPQIALAKPVGILITPTPQPRFETPGPIVRPAPVPTAVFQPPPIPKPKPAEPEIEAAVASITPETEPVETPKAATIAPAPVRAAAAPLPTPPETVPATSKASAPVPVVPSPSAGAPIAPAPVVPAPVMPTPVVPKIIVVPPPQPIEAAAPAIVVPTPATTPPVQVAEAKPAPKPVTVSPPIAVTAKPKFSMANLLDDVKSEAPTVAARVPTDSQLRALRLAAKKKAEEKARVEAEVKAKADAKKAEEEAKRAIERKNPAREWVQVAGGNNRHGFSRTWEGLKDDHPDVFKGRSAYYTPLNHTFRILVGPFKSPRDSRAFLNGMTKAGLSGFTFASEAGQEVTKISGE